MEHFNFSHGKKISFYFLKIFIFSAFCIFSSQSVIAQKCDLKILKDDFSSSKAVYSKDVTLASVFPLIGSKKPWELVMSFMLDGSTCTIIVTHKDQGLSSKLENIFFKFKDETILKLENPLDAGTYNTGKGYIFESTAFVIGKEELMKLSSVDLIKFKTSLRNNINYPLVEEEIKQKNIDKIRNDASYILNEYNLVANESLTKRNDTKIVEFKCEYNNDLIDAFTKQRRVDTKGAILFDEKEVDKRLYLNVLGNNTNGINGIQFEWGLWTKSQVDQSSVQTALLFDQIDLLLENDELVSLKDKAVPKFIVSGSFYISYKLFAIDDPVWAKLKISSVKNMRILLNNEVIISPKIEKNNYKSIMNVINCIDALGIPKSK